MKKQHFILLSLFSTVILIFVSIYLMKIFVGDVSQIYSNKIHTIFVIFFGIVALTSLEISSFFIERILFSMSSFVSITFSALIIFCLVSLYNPESSKYVSLFIPETVFLIFLLMVFSIAQNRKNFKKLVQQKKILVPSFWFYSGFIFFSLGIEFLESFFIYVSFLFFVSGFGIFMGNFNTSDKKQQKKEDVSKKDQIGKEKLTSNLEEGATK